MSEFPSRAYDRWRLRAPGEGERSHRSECPQHEDNLPSEEECICEDLEMAEAEDYGEALFESRRLDE